MDSILSHEVVLTPIDSGTDVVDRIRSLINSGYAHLFKAVIAHGSVGTEEVVSYSDFDGLLIVEDKAIGSVALQEFIVKSMKIIYEFDPLQHHGWFQISTSDLDQYSEGYLPIAVLNHSKLIYPENRDEKLNLRTNFPADYSRGLELMLATFENRIERNWKPSNMYQLKSFLSEIMLLPTLYYAYLQGEAIFKRESFDHTKHLFTKEEWKVITICTEMRENWSYQLNFIQKWIMTRPGKPYRKLTQKLVAPKISGDCKSYLSNEFYASLTKLIARMKKEST